MHWTFWLLSGVAVFAVCMIVWWVLDQMGFLDGHWDDGHFGDDWGDE